MTNHIIGLADWNASAAVGCLTLRPVNGSPRIVYQCIAGHPVPYQATIQRQGQTLSLSELRRQIALDGPVAYWLRWYCQVDLNHPSLMRGMGRAYVALLSPQDQAARQASLLPIDCGFALRVHDMYCAVGPDVNHVTYDLAGQIRIAYGGPAEVDAELRRAGYRIVRSAS